MLSNAMIDTKFKTKFKTADGEPMVLFHNEPVSTEELAEFEKLTKDELVRIAKEVFGFTQHRIP